MIDDDQDLKNKNYFKNYLGVICRSLFIQALSEGLTILSEDMEKSEPYDHDIITKNEDYNKKNEYFNRVNLIGYSFLTNELTGLSKIFYWKMLELIVNFTNKKLKPFNKGMTCANLGVSTLAEGDFDAGITYLLWAFQEDRKWSGDQNSNIFANKLYTQFTKAENRKGISVFGRKAPWLMLKDAINKYNSTFKDNINLKILFTELEGYADHRALLEGSLWVIHRNLALLEYEKKYDIYSGKKNIYTRLRSMMV